MSDHPLTRDEVEHVARLARLALTPDEIEALTTEFGRDPRARGQVSALDTAGVPPTAHPLPLVNVFRTDVARAGLPRDEVLGGGARGRGRPVPGPRILGEAP